MWDAIESKLDGAEFFLGEMGRDLVSPIVGNPTMAAIAISSGAVVGHPWQRRFYHHLAVGDSCPPPPDERAPKVAAWAHSTHGGGPPLVDMAAAPVVRLAFCAHHRQTGNGHRLASPGIPPVLDLEE